MSASQFPQTEWRKSSYSTATSECVEVAVACDVVAARDSKNPTGAMLTVSPATWHGFLAHLAAG